MLGRYPAITRPSALMAFGSESPSPRLDMPAPSTQRALLIVESGPSAQHATMRPSPLIPTARYAKAGQGPSPRSSAAPVLAFQRTARPPRAPPTKEPFALTQ